MRTSSGRNVGARLGPKRLVYHSTRPTHNLLGARPRSSQCTLGALLTDRRTSLLLDWATSAGLQLPKVKPAEFDDGLRGMVAEKKVSYGDVLVSVPAGKAFLAVEDESCPFPDSMAPDFWQRSPLWVKLALKLVHERRQGEASPWNAWVANLPQDIQLPLLWADTLLDELQYPHIIAKVRAQRAEWREWHTQLQASLPSGAPAVEWEEFYWAAACVRTRTFYGPHFATTTVQKVAVGVALLAASAALTSQWLEAGAVSFFVSTAAVAGYALWELDVATRTRRLAFMPVLDLLNHSYLSNESVCFYDYGWSRHVVKSLREYSPGEQVFMSYGRMSNDEAVQFYGFLEQGNDADTYVLSRLQLWLEQQLGGALPAARLAELKAAKLLKALQEPTISASGTFTPATLQVVRYLLADDASAAAGPAAFQEAGSLPQERGVQRALVAAVESELESLPTSLDEDFQLLQGQYIPAYKVIRSASEQGGGALAFAQLFRLEKKKLLFLALQSLGGSGSSTALPEQARGIAVPSAQ